TGGIRHARTERPGIHAEQLSTRRRVNVSTPVPTGGARLLAEHSGCEFGGILAAHDCDRAGSAKVRSKHVVDAEPSEPTNDHGFLTSRLVPVRVVDRHRTVK